MITRHEILSEGYRRRDLHRRYEDIFCAKSLQINFILKKHRNNKKFYDLNCKKISGFSELFKEKILMALKKALSQIPIEYHWEEEELIYPSICREVICYLLPLISILA